MTYTLNGREVDLGLDNVRNKEVKLTYLTFVLFKCIILFPKSLPNFLQPSFHQRFHRLS